jgi:predicted transcriptional regulator
MKIRQNLYLDREVSEALEALAAGETGNKSRVANDALRDWLARRGSKEVDDLLCLRLDRISREIGHTRRDLEVLLESLSLFVRYQLMVTAPLPEADAAAVAIGRERFEKFVAQVGRQIASNQRSIDPASGVAS